MNNKNYCVIMAGGVGSRFWPLSKSSMPKQFLDMSGMGKSLIRQTYERFSKICPIENIIIVTNKQYESLVKQHIPELADENILLEPLKRNTAPCIAYSTFKIDTIAPDANVVVAPSDHIITDENKFAKAIKKGLDFVNETDNLLTLGVKPKHPETEYGYIQINPDVKPVKAAGSATCELRKVKTFTEKPNLEMAEVFYNSDEFYWNSGIFISPVKALLDAYEKHLPELFNAFNDGKGIYNTPDEDLFVNTIYAGCRNISIDYGIMEKAENVYVLCVDFGWIDLGNWKSLYDHSNRDENGNVIKGENVKLYHTENCIVNVPDKKLVVLQGLDGYIVVESDNVLMVCKKENEQQIRQFVNDVKIEKGEKFV